MAHELDFSQGKAAIAYAGETPWHGLGAKLERGAPIDVWAKAAGMDFDLDFAPVHAMIGGVPADIPSRHAVYRKDTNKVLSIMSKRFKLVQPRQVLEFFQRYVGGYAEIETAGVLFEGRRFWALARLEGEIDVAGDKTLPYLLCATSCDGSTPTTVKATTVRVVCNNTLSMTEQDRAIARVRHTAVFNAVTVAETVEAARSDLAAQAAMLKKLASIKLSNMQAQAFVAKLFKSDDVELNRASKKVLALYEGGGIGSDLESAKGTAYGMLNAITEYADWVSGSKQSNRLASSWFGAMDSFKSQAAQELVKLETV